MNRSNVKWIIIGLCLLSGCSSTLKREDIFIKAQQIKAEVAPLTVENSTPPPTVKSVFSPSYPELPKEKLFFKAKYLGIPFCDYIIQNKGKMILDGREVYALEIVVKTNAILEKLFQNKDHYVSYMDTKKMVVVRHEEYVKGVLESAVDFDYKNHVAKYKNFINNTVKTTPIPDKLVDIVTGGYYLRIVPWEIGDTIEMNIYADEIVYNFIGLVRSKTTLNVAPYGKQQAYHVKPYLFQNGAPVKNLSAESFFSSTIPRVPLKAVINTFLGGVSVVSVNAPKEK